MLLAVHRAITVNNCCISPVVQQITASLRFGRINWQTVVRLLLASAVVWPISAQADCTNCACCAERVSSDSHPAASCCDQSRETVARPTSCCAQRVLTTSCVATELPTGGCTPLDGASPCECCLPYSTTTTKSAVLCCVGASDDHVSFSTATPRDEASLELRAQVRHRARELCALGPPLHALCEVWLI